VTDHFEKHLTIDIPDVAVVEHLARHTPLSKQQIKLAMKNGCVWLQSSHGMARIRRVKKVLQPGDALHIYYDAVIQNTPPSAAELITDENEYSLWNKPCGMYSQGTKWGDHCSLYRWAEQQLQPQRPAFPVHRLDRAANGLMIIAHSKRMAAHFSGLFRTRNIQKRYRTTVEGRLDNLTLPYSITQDIDDKPAHSKIISADAHEDRTDLIVEIETGRKHQIRKHLSQLGHPVVGDRLYGTKNSDMNLQLQSYYLKFTCPITNTIKEYSLKR
jgi:tRNA pseudouridine32 synthase/23S rRNA pseudouridine746 synthase